MIHDSSVREGIRWLAPSRLFFSRHARNRMRRYSRTVALTDNDIADAILYPDVVQPSVRGRSNAWKQRDTDWLRVTFIEQIDRIVVVTVTVKQRGPADGGDNDEADI